MNATVTHSVLIVDDNPDEIDIAKRLLTKMGRGLMIEATLRGETALGLLRSGKSLPSVIFLDLKMPGMSGFDVLRHIRADERLKHIPVIIITSSSLEADQQEAYRAGATYFLHKSFDMDQFGREIEAVLDRYLMN